MHAVEIRRFGEGVAEPMNLMRVWLDHHQIQPAIIQLSFHPGKEIRFRLVFKSADEAAAFADSFNGELLDGSSAVAA